MRDKDGRPQRPVTSKDNYSWLEKNEPYIPDGLIVARMVDPNILAMPLSHDVGIYGTNKYGRCRYGAIGPTAIYGYDTYGHSVYG